jgi:hypothetical protein
MSKKRSKKMTRNWKNSDTRGVNPRKFTLSTGRVVTLRDYYNDDGTWEATEFDWADATPREQREMLAILARVA